MSLNVLEIGQLGRVGYVVKTAEAKLTAERVGASCQIS